MSPAIAPKNPPTFQPKNTPIIFPINPILSPVKSKCGYFYNAIYNDDKNLFLKFYMPNSAR